MDSDVEDLIKTCLPCQAVAPLHKPLPVIMSKLPENSWTDISIDFYGPLPSGEKLLVIIDNFSRFPFVEIMKSTTAESVRNRLEILFTTFGYPSSIRSDNGPPFKSARFKSYFKSRGIKHVKIMPLWPRRKGIVEAFMKMLRENVQIKRLQNKDWRTALNDMLLKYRNAPHSITNQTPSDVQPIGAHQVDNHSGNLTAL